MSRGAVKAKAEEIPGDPITLPFISPACPPQIAAQKQWELPRFLRIEKIGSGMASTVYLAVDACSRNKVALKVYDKRQLTEPLLRGVITEVAIHGRLVHPHILALFAAFEDGNYLGIVLDYAGEGDLYKRLPGVRREEHAVAKYIIAPLLSALATMHEQHILHRDLKPENMLLKSSHIYLADFGFSINSTMGRPVTRLGTTHFMAPELILHEPEQRGGTRRDKVPRPVRHDYGPSVDIWAVGAITYETLLHRPPFDGPKEEDVIVDIIRNRPSYPDTISVEARDFLKACLTYDATQRPTACELYEHPFVCKSMPREKWEKLHPRNFATASKALESMREMEGDGAESQGGWDPASGVPRPGPARRDSFTVGSQAGDAEDAAMARDRRKATHSQFKTTGSMRGISPAPSRGNAGGSSGEAGAGAAGRSPARQGSVLGRTASPAGSAGARPQGTALSGDQRPGTGSGAAPARAGLGDGMANQMMKMAITNSQTVRGTGQAAEAAAARPQVKKSDSAPVAPRAATAGSAGSGRSRDGGDEGKKGFFGKIFEKKE